MKSDTALVTVVVLVATLSSSPSKAGRLRRPIEPHFRFGVFMTGSDIKKAQRQARHPIDVQEDVEKVTHRKLSRSELVELAKKRLKMLEELNTSIDEELVPLVTEELNKEHVNIDVDPNHMLMK